MKFSTKKCVLVFLVIWLSTLNMLAQAGSIDPTFNPVDSGFWKGNGLNDMVSNICIKKDGKLLLGGNFKRYNDEVSVGFVSCKKDGSIDKELDPKLNNTYCQIIVEQNDGKVIIYGLFSEVLGVARRKIARLNADGTLDSSFNPGGLFPSIFQISSICIQADDKIVICGEIETFNNTPVNGILRLNTDGSLDTTFNTGGGLENYSVRAMKIQSDGKIIIGGLFSLFNNTKVNNLIRLNPDGTLDNSFKPAVSNEIRSVVLQKDNKILMVESFKNGNNTPNRIIRLNMDGSIDASFVVSASQDARINCLSIQKDEKIMIGGLFDSYNNESIHNLARLNVDGTLDPSFDPKKGTDKEVYAVSIQDDGEIIVGGNFKVYNETSRNYIARIHNDGSLDSTVFNISGSGVNGSLFSMKIQKDDKIVLAGLFSEYNGTKRNNIVRMHSNGLLDNTFDPGISSNDIITSIAIQNDDKMIVGGNFTKFNEKKCLGLVRLQSDGSVDSSFNFAGSKTDNVIENISLQSDGKIVIFGYFDTIQGMAVKNLARLLPDGNIDTSFKSVIDGVISWRTTIQPDGKIIVVGIFSSYNNNNNIPRNIIRINTDASIDNNFNAGTGANASYSFIRCVALQKDNKIVIGGRFTSFDGNTVNGICRLNADGSYDNSFDTGLGVENSFVESISIQENGKIIIAGTFTKYNGNQANHICRLNPDGSFDNSFVCGTGFDNAVYVTAIQKDGRILFAGDFYSYNGTGRNGIARVISDDINGVLEEQYDYDYSTKLFPNPGNGKFTIESDKMTEISVFDSYGKTVMKKTVYSDMEVLDLSREGNGIYFVKIMKGSEQVIKKLIINN